MARYRFVGNYSEIADKVYSDFGAQVDISPEQYEVAILGGAAVIPDEDFQKLFAGVDAKCMRRFANPALRTNAPEDFKARERAALLIVFETKNALENPVAPQEVEE